MPKKSIKLGDEIQDVVSKIQGICCGHTKYLDGTEFWILQPPAGEDETKPPEQLIPAAYCKYISEGVYPQTKPIMGFHVRNEKSS